MAVNKTTLKNGVRILTKKIPHVRSVSLGIWVNVGARDESSEESGLSHFIEHMIFKGTLRRSSFQISREFDAIGGQTNAFTSMEATCYHAKVLDKHMEIMVDILSDVFLNSVFDSGEVDRERPVIFQEIGMMEDTPDDYIHVLSETAYWGDNSLGRPVIGNRNNINRFDSDRLKDFFHRLYQPGRIVISAAGNVDHEALVKLLTPVFESISPGNGFPDRETPLGCSGVSLNPRELEQVHICLETSGISAADPRRYTASLMNTILGGNMSSRLFQEIRERRGLAYSIYSFMSSYTDTGVSGIYAGIHPEKAPECVELFLKEMQKLRETRISGAELKDAREYTRAALLLSAESVDNQMFRLAQNEIHMGEYLSMDEIMKALDAVTEEDILQLARNLYDSSPLTLTLLGPVSDPAPYEKLLAEF